MSGTHAARHRSGDRNPLVLAVLRFVRGLIHSSRRFGLSGLWSRLEGHGHQGPAGLVAQQL